VSESIPVTSTVSRKPPFEQLSQVPFTFVFVIRGHRDPGGEALARWTYSQPLLLPVMQTRARLLSQTLPRQVPVPGK
jgi:hypothetical protein